MCTGATEPINPSAASSCILSIGNIQFISLLTSPLSYPPWDTISSLDGIESVTILKLKSPAKLKRLSSLWCTPAAVARAILISLKGLVTGAQTEGGVIGTNISDCIPLTTVKLIFFPPFYFVLKYFE